jgi:pimeloyl-ACP methyl ester carboxylesterase
MRQFTRLIAVALLWTCAVAQADVPRRAEPPSAAVIDDVAYTRPQQRIAVEDGRHLNLYCLGKGSPTVIFDSGLGDSSKAWGLVQPAISRITRSCSYDRAGLGFSDPTPRPGNSAAAVEDLHRLVQSGALQPPLVLVGHSYGGMNVRLYAATHRDEVAGIVLVDGSLEDLAPLFWDIDGAFVVDYLPYVATLESCLARPWGEFVPGSDQRNFCGAVANPRYSAAINAIELQRARYPARLQGWIGEFRNFWFVSGAQLRAARGDLGELPLLLLHRPLQGPAPRETASQRAAKNVLLPQLRRLQAAESRCGQVRQIPSTGHYIQLDQPQAVMDAIVEVMAQRGVCRR